MTGSGSTIVGSGELPAAGDGAYLWQRKLANHGLFAVHHEAELIGGEGAVFENLGTFSMNGRMAVERPGATIINKGTLQHIEGSDPAHVAWSIDNEGTVSAVSGSLEFTGGGTGGTSAPGTWLGTGGEILFKERIYELGEEVPLEGMITASIASLAFGGRSQSQTSCGDVRGSAVGRAHVPAASWLDLPSLI
jgi:hypothetical protein